MVTVTVPRETCADELEARNQIEAITVLKHVNYNQNNRNSLQSKEEMMKTTVILLGTRRKIMISNYPKCTKIDSEALTNHEIT